MMRHNRTGLVLFIFIIAIAELSWGQEESKTSLLKRLNDESRANLANKINSKEDLKRFQLDLLKKRNSQCVTNEELENFGENFESIAWDENISQQASFNKKCLDSAKLGEFFASDNSSASLDDLAQLVLGQLYNDGCDLCKQDHKHSSSLNAWIFGMLAATLITITSFSGAFLLPLTKHKHYKKILMFLISLAVGTLTGTAIIHLIPQAYGIDADANYSEHHMYVWKSLVISGGLYLFFLVEQIMRFFIQFRKHRKSQKEALQKIEEAQKSFRRAVRNSLAIANESSSSSSDSDEDKEDEYSSASLKSKRINKNTQTSIALQVARSRALSVSLSDGEEDSIAPVAWIIICSEGLHNFIDGLSIGAAFTETALKGFSLSLAIICEEFPHKLGDFAILLAAGMSFKTALTCNFLSSCLIYVGIAVGIVAGENLGINTWIYAIAGGMFLYIAVCDMIPELGAMGQELEKAYRKAKQEKFGPLADENSFMHAFSVKLKISNMIVQNAGVLIGYFLMLLLALYAEKIVM